MSRQNAPAGPENAAKQQPLPAATCESRVNPSKTVGFDAERLVDPQELAQILGVTRDYVYRHAGDLGGVRLSSGPRARLRFNPALALERLSVCSASRTSG